MKAITTIAVVSTLCMHMPVAAQAQTGTNLWNPYHPPLSQAAMAPGIQGTPTSGVAGQAMTMPAPAQSQAQSQSQAQQPSRFAPPGLEQQLAAGPFMQPSFRDNGGQYPPVGGQINTPPPLFMAPVAGGYRAPAPYPAPGYGNGYGAIAPTVGYPQNYGGYPQGFGGYPQGYGGYPQGYGNNGPFQPFGFPGGPGSFGQFPGNIMNGDVPGFNFSPFGFF